MAKYKISSLKQLFDVCFKRCYIDDFEQLKKYVLDFYRVYRRFEPVVVKSEFSPCRQQTIKTKIHRQRITEEAFSERYGWRYWMRFYFIVRLHEHGIEVTEQEIQLVMTEAYKIYKKVDKEKAFEYIVNRILQRVGRGGNSTQAYPKIDIGRQLIVKS